MSSAGRTRLAYIKEATFDTAPASPDMKAVPYNTGDAFANSRDTLTSGRVQSTRSPRQTILGTNAPEKSISAELVWQSFDDLLAAGFGEQWLGGDTVTDTVTVAATTITLDSGNWSDYFDEGVQIGAYLVFDDDGTLVPLYVSNMATNVLTVTQLDEATSPALTVAASVSKAMIFGAHGLRLAPDGSNTIVFSASAKTVTLSGTAVTGKWADFKVGDNIFFSGTSSNEGWHKITAIASDVLTLAAAPTDETINTDIDVDVVTDRGTVGNANTLPSFTLEEQFLDHNSDVGNYRQISGVKISQIAFNLQPSAYVELSLTLMGASITDFSSSSIANSVTEPSDSEGFNTFTGGFLLAGVAANISGFDINLNNQHNRNFNLFSRSAAAMTDGIPEITGNVNAYFDSEVYSTMFYNETAFQPYVRVIDASGNSYAIEVSTAKFTGESISIGDIDVTEALPFAVQPNSSGNEVYLYRQPAAR